MKRAYTLLLLLTCMAIALQAQVYNEMSPDGTITQRDEYGNSGNFNPNKRDTTRASKDIPIGVKVWNIDTRFGDVIPEHHLRHRCLRRIQHHGQQLLTSPEPYIHRPSSHFAVLLRPALRLHDEESWGVPVCEHLVALCTHQL